MFRRVSILLSFVYISFFARGAAAEDTVVSDSELSPLIRVFAADQRDLRRYYDLPLSDQRRARLAALYDAAQARLQGARFSTLSTAGRVDYLLWRNHLDQRRADIELDRQRADEIAELVSFSDTILSLERARRAMKPFEPRAAAGRIADLVEQVRALQERVKRRSQPDAAATAPATRPAEPDGDIVVAPHVARRASDATDRLRRTLRIWFGFYDGYDPTFSWWVAAPYQEARRALNEYGDHLRKTVAGLQGEADDPLVGEPLGRAALAEALGFELIAYTPEELVRIGEQRLAWVHAEMADAAVQLGLAGWRAALERVKQDHVPPGEQDDLIAQQAQEIIAWLEARELITIPPIARETWHLTMISPQTQKVLPYAAYGGQNMMVAYPTSSMSHADKLMSMRGNNRHACRLVTAHELLPGHHLQGFMASRHRPYRRLFATPFFGEGWPLYWEMTLYDLGYVETPEQRVGALFWRGIRAARIIVSLRFHLGEMEPDEMVDFLVDEVGLERFTATSEVRRYIGDGYGPLYQCAYLTGGLQLRALRREVVDTGRLGEREFHDRLLTYGAVPVELIRADMLDLPLTENWRPTWRFADAP